MDLIAASLIAALVKYQLPLAAGLGTWFTYLASKRTWFQQLGDWGKKAVVAIAAFVVVLAINAVGGQVSADLQGLVDGVLAALLGGGVAAAPVALAYRFGRVQLSAQGTSYPPGASRRGSATLGGMLAIAMLGLLTIACVPSPAGASPAPFGVNLSVVADTLKLTVPCTADAPAIKCRITPRATIAGRPVTFGATPDIAAGQSATILATFTAVGGDTLVVNASSAGVYPDGSLQTPRDADSEVRWVTPFDAGAQVRSFTIEITVVRP